MPTRPARPDLPCAIFRGYLGVDLPKVNPNIKRITCPFTGEQLAAVPAIRPDVAIVHALKADRAGNVLIEGIVGVQKEVVLAVEALDRDGRGDRRRLRPAQPQCGDPAELDGRRPSPACRAARIPPMRTATTSATTPIYKAWDAIARDRDTFLAWMKTNVLEKGPEAFAVHSQRLRSAAE